MTQEELNFIKDSFSQIIDDIAGNPDWGDAARAVASNLGTLERELGKKVIELPSNLDKVAVKHACTEYPPYYEMPDDNWKERAGYVKGFKVGVEWQLNKDSEKHYFVQLKNIKDAWQELEKSNPEIKHKPAICFYKGAEWMNNTQMKMPNSTKLISEWNNVKTILEEKDFRGDEWRLAYNAFMFGFSRGINTQKTEK